MQQSSKISDYLKVVCDQIRWKKAHAVISEEIENHIVDQKDAFIAKGLDEETATTKAINEMGDPIDVGSQFDRTHRPQTEWGIIVLTGIALLLGLVIRIVVTYDTDMSWMISKSVVWMIIGIGVMGITYSLDFTIIGKYPKIIFFGLIAIVIGLILVSKAVNGRYFYVQFVYLIFPTAFAGIVYSMRNKGYLGIIISGIFFGISALVGINMVITPTVIYSLTGLILLTLAIAKGWFNVNKVKAMLLVYIPTVMVMVVVTIIAIVTRTYQFKRIQAAINPSLDPMGSGYIIMMTREMISSAKIIGQGELAVDASSIIPGIYDESLLTYLIQKFGWVSFVIIMAVFLLFIIRFFVLCLRQKSVLGRLVSTSILITFTIQVVVYTLYNLGFQLIIPLSLPLISYGGTSTIINMMLIGIMLSVFKSGDLVRDKPITAMSGENKIFQMIDGKIIIDLNIKG